MFYYNGINFSLRGGEEHRNLKLSQLSFGKEACASSSGELEFVNYTEFTSKNRPGGKKQLNLENKEVQHFAQPALGSRCPVFLLKLYISKLPDEAKQQDIFYCKPKPKDRFDSAMVLQYTSWTQQIEWNVKIYVY